MLNADFTGNADAERLTGDETDRMTRRRVALAGNRTVRGERPAGGPAAPDT